MKAVNSVILRSERNYNNKVSLNDIEYTVNVDIDNVESINRTATVVAAPVRSNLSEGDKIIIHHNILREKIHMNGTKVKSQFHIANDYYHCPVSEVLLKKDAKGEWETLLDFVFIKPIKEHNVELGHGLVLTPESRKGMQSQRATLAITNKNLKGVTVGDTIIFSKNSEHEFFIDGEKLYKCEVQDILAKV